MDTYLIPHPLLQKKKKLLVYFFSFSCSLAHGTSVRGINIFYDDKIHKSDENISPNSVAVEQQGLLSVLTSAGQYHIYWIICRPCVYMG